MTSKKEPITNPRREFLLEVVNVDQLKGLEIGPLTDPLIVTEDLQGQGEIFYLDHLSTDELKEKYADDCSVDVKKIIPVDIVCRDGDLVAAIAEYKFDYVVASHVIEHVPNLLQFLQDVEKTIRPGGRLILIIPDKRFTFDLNRPITSFGSVLEKYRNKETKPSLSAVYDHFALANGTNAHHIWFGVVSPEDKRLLASEQFAWKAAQSVLNEGAYFDVHVNIFTPASFFEILRKAISHNLVGFEVEKFRDTAVGQIEFMVSLKKTEKNSADNASSKSLTTIPTLPLDSLLSPYMPQIKQLSGALDKVTETNGNLHNEVQQLRDRSARESAERLKIETELIQAQKVLNRRSVRFALSFVDKICSRFLK